MDNQFVYDMPAHRARVSANREAVYDYETGTRYTYQQLQDRACVLANYFTKELGIKKGECVALCSSNHIAAIDVLLQSFKTGIIVSSYNPKLKAKELSSMILRETPKVVFFEASLEDKMLEMLPNLPENTRFVSLYGISEKIDSIPYEQIQNGIDTEFTYTADLQPEDIQMYLHTGGTTGIPKTAMLSYRCIYFNACSEIMMNGLSMFDVSYVFLPLFHTSGWNVIMMPLLFCGGRVVLKKAFDAGEALKIIREEKLTCIMAVPAVYKMMAQHPDFMKTDFASVKWMETGGAPARKEIMEPYWNRGIKLINAYGMTENPNGITPSLAEMTIDDIRKKWNSVGFPMYLNRWKLVDEQGNEVPEGKEGELILKGPLTFSGYYKNEEETEKSIVDGWFHTGDIARKDSDGYYYIVGRKKNMFISNGENIYPVEIEEVIRQYPGIQDVCVIGVPDDHFDEVGKALLVIDEEKFDMNELIEHVKQNLPTIKRPKHYKIIDSMPENDAGKLDLKRLKQTYGSAE